MKFAYHLLPPNVATKRLHFVQAFPIAFFKLSLVMSAALSFTDIPSKPKWVYVHHSVLPIVKYCTYIK